MATRERRDPRQTAHEQVHRALKAEITSGLLPGGTRLIQSELAERLGFSITPVREALRDLATEGLVRFDAHRGAVVHRADLAEMREVYEMRRRLEPLVLELAVERITPELIERARALHERMLAESVPARWVEDNRMFHGIFMEACGWKRLAQTVALLHVTAAPYVTVTMSLRPDLMRRGNDDHARMLEACETGDTVRAAALAEAHMDITKDAIEQQLGAPPDLGAGIPEPA